jgi:hypothetical protein
MAGTLDSLISDQTGSRGMNGGCWSFWKVAIIAPRDEQTHCRVRKTSRF